MLTTNEYALASYLLSKGYPIRRTTLNDYAEVVFQFDDNPSTKQEELDYYQNKGLIEVQDFLASQRRVKRMIFKTKENTYETNKQRDYRR